MIKRLFLLPVVFLLGSGLFFSQTNLSFLKINDPNEEQQKKRIFPIELRSLQEIVKQANIGDVSVNIDMMNKEGKTVANLGKIKKGEIRWEGTVLNNEWLAVKFDKSAYLELLSLLKEKSAISGYKIVIWELVVQVAKNIKPRDLEGKYFDKEKNVHYSTDLTFSEFQDLSVKMQYPIQISHQEDIKDKVSVTLKNKGTSSCANFFIDLFLAKEGKTVTANEIIYDQDLNQGSVIKMAAKEILLIKPGDEQTLAFDQPIIIPADISPGNYFLGIICDSQKKIQDMNLKDNLDIGLSIVQYTQVSKIKVDIPNVELTFEPDNFAFKIMSNDTVISDGKEWRKCRKTACIYHLLFTSWQDIFWEVNTFERAAWIIKNGEFCKSGGNAKELKVKVLVSGGSKITMPTKFVLSSSNAKLVFDAKINKFDITVADISIGYLPFWKICWFKPHLFHVKHVAWPDFYWEIDTFRKQVNLMSGVEICKESENRKPLNFNVTVE